jgi:hypothetical protein
MTLRALEERKESVVKNVHLDDKKKEGQAVGGSREKKRNPWTS